MNIVVLGMHRSGTSLACGLLSQAGVYFGETNELIPKNPENPKGFFERKDIRAINDRLLHARRSDWCEISSLDAVEPPPELLDATREECRSILTGLHERTATGAVGIKEPRLCLLMPFWREVLDADTFHILVHRDPHEIAISLKNRNGIPAGVANFLTEQYLGRALLHLQGRACHIVSFRSLIEDPVGATRAMVDAIEARGQALKRLNQRNLRRFASRKLYRSRPGDEPFRLSRRLRGWAESLQSGRLPVVRAMKITPSNQVLDFQHAWRFERFLEHDTELQHKVRRIATLEARVVSNREFDRKVKELEAKLRQVRGELSAERRQVRNISAELAGVNSSLAERQQDVARLEGEVRERETQIGKVQAELGGTRGELVESVETLARTRDELERLRTEAEERQAELTASIAELEQSHAALESARQTLGATQSALETTRSELQATRSDLAGANAELEQSRADLAGARSELRELEEVLAGARRDLEQTTRAMLANDQRLSLALTQLKAQEETIRQQSQAAERDQALLGLADQILDSNAQLHTSTSWKLLRPVLGTMLNAGYLGRRSNILRDIDAMLDEYGQRREAAGTGLAPARGGAAGLGLKPARKLPATALVITWDVGHNPVGRSYMLAEVLDRVFRNVVIIGFQFPRYGSELWEPLRHSRIPVITLPGANFPGFAHMLNRIAARIDPDIVFACKARLPSVQLGALFKQRLACPLVCDMDDHELTFFDGGREVSLEEMEGMPPGSASEALEPYDGFWTGVAQHCRRFCDEVLVSNPALESEFGGTLVPHVRDETVFDPAIYSRDLMRSEFKLPLDARITLFFGTPRKHKGIDWVARAVADLDDDRALLLVVGDAPDRRDIARLRDIAGDRVRTVGNQPFDRIPAILAMADAVCLAQDLAHPTSAYQLPAKAIDAIAMGIPLLVTGAAPLKRLTDLGLATEITADNIAATLGRVLAGSNGRAPDQEAQRRLFLEHFSYDAAARELRGLAERLLGNPAQPAGFEQDFPRFLAAQVRLLGLDDPPDESPADSGRDLVLFWKQNDTRLYGRRVDMFIKYLATRPDVRRVVVFDAPMSEFDLLRLRDGATQPSQNRWIYIRTYEKLLGKLDQDNVSHNVFLHPPGIYDLPGRATPGRRPLVDGYFPYIESVLAREGVTASEAIFVFYPKNFLANDIIDHFGPEKVVVDVVDDHREWPGTTAAEAELLTRNYEQLLGRADMAFVNCQPMLEKMAPLTRDLRLVANGCDSDPPCAEPAQDEAFAALEAWQGKVIGFVGNLEAKIDVDLIEKIAFRFPLARIVLVGSTHASEKALGLQAMHNVLMPGVVPYDEIGAWIRHFDVAIVPHLHTGMTENMNPLKIFVYLQWGVPVVSTDIPNIGYRGELLRTSASHEDFLAQVDDFLQRPPTDIEARRSEFVAENDWKARFKSHVDELLG